MDNWEKTKCLICLTKEYLLGFRYCGAMCGKLFVKTMQKYSLGELWKPYLRETKGTTPNVRPQAAWTKTEKIIITMMDALKDPTCPRMIQNTPPKVCIIHKAHSLPRIPNLLAILSEIIPPAGLENKFAKPKLAAIIPAVWSFRLNLS
ncbi:hypothetical protein QQP08_008958 [Theobroma cacao]|nr:hypothetical protein QQP08_007770 [Theobroma cacao]WRX16471.1 hypothetical protein QQP08_008958 [Theobroma cacao]